MNEDDFKLEEADLEKLYKKFVSFIKHDADDNFMSGIAEFIGKTKSTKSTDTYLIGLILQKHLEILSEEMPKLHKKYIVDEDEGSGLELLNYIFVMQTTTEQVMSKYYDVCENFFDNLNPFFKNEFLRLSRPETEKIEKRVKFMLEKHNNFKKNKK